MQDHQALPVEKCTHHLFLSVTSETLPIAIALKEKLNQLGYKSWLYTEVIDEILMEKIFNGIKKSVMFVAFISQKYIESEYCMREIRLAGILKKPIMPIVCEKFDVWPPEPIIMQVMDIIYIPLFQNNNVWNESLLSHLCARLPSLDIPLTKEIERKNSFCLFFSPASTNTEQIISNNKTIRRSSHDFTNDFYLADELNENNRADEHKSKNLTVSNKSKKYERSISFHGDMLDDPFG